MYAKETDIIRVSALLKLSTKDTYVNDVGQWQSVFLRFGLLYHVIQPISRKTWRPRKESL